MLAAEAIAAGMWPPHNRRAVNKQWYDCMSTEDLCLSARVSEQEVHRQLAIFSNSSAELIFGLD